MTTNQSRRIQVRKARLRLIAALALTIVVAPAAPAQSKRRVFMPGQRGVVFDERLSALRAQPNVKAPLVQRMRRGRRIGILGAATAKDGARFFRVAISRNTRGWVLADSVIRPGFAADAEKLMRLIGETRDDFTKARLAKLYADEFRSTKLAPKALMILAESAESAAERAFARRAAAGRR